MYTVRAVGFLAACSAVLGLFGALSGAAPARAESCPGNPNALGTSRVLPISFAEYAQLGRMQYPQTLPLADHEVVLTFDDGPMRLLSDKALDILNSQCVKVTYFIIGQMAHYFPDIVRREYASGDVIGTHSEHHPLRFDKLTDEEVQQEIDEGIASVGAALGDPAEVAPFFRIPGLGRSPIVEQELARRQLTVFSADVVADDWFRHITPAQIIQRAMSRLEQRGRGILLLHDIHPATVLALSGLLQQLKDNGFHVVQVVPAAVGPLIAGGPKAWALAAAMPQAALVDAGAVSPAWPQPDTTVASAANTLAAPDAAAFNLEAPLRLDAGLVDAGADSTLWPQVSEMIPAASAADFPAPGLRDLGISMRGQKLIGAQNMAPAGPPERPAGALRASGGHRLSTERRRVRHVRLRLRQPARRAGSDRHRAALPLDRRHSS